MQFSLLGTVAMRDSEGRGLPLGGPRQRAVLAALLLRRGGLVGDERLVDEVWGEELPSNPARTLRTYVSRIRSLLDDPDRLAREGNGYRLAVDGAELDLCHFERLSERGHEFLAGGREEEAAACLREALELWRGDALADLGGTPLVAWARPQVTELWFGTLADRIDADLALGRYEDVIGELRSLLERDPLRERSVGQLMRALYGAGRQVEALTVFRDIRRRLIDELGVEPSRELVEVHQNILGHDEALSAGAHPPPPAEQQPGRLPRPLTSFVGREAELIAIGSLLDEARLVTITGIGGGGKSRLAIEVAHQRIDAHAAGVRFVPLASVDDDSLVRHTIADAVAFPSRGGVDSTQLAAYLENQDVLLVVDNCEHILAAVAELVEHLLERCPNMRVLATSRIPLGVHGERVWRLPPLRVPPERAELSTENVAAYEAVRLFEECARAADPDFVIDDRSAAAVARVCRRLAGIPLAIELAASWVKTLSIDDLAARLERSLGLLRSTSATAAARHQTLRATLDWSCELLEAPARALLRRLSVFRSAFPLSGVEHVAAVPGEAGGPEVVDLLDRLVACSLVEANPRYASVAPYRLLEPVRLYATDRLEAEDDAAMLRRAHAEWWLGRMQAEREQLRRGDMASEIAADGQVDDLRAAVSWSIAAGAAELAQRLVAACYEFWWAYGLMQEGVRWTRQALELSTGTPPEVRGSALAGLALMEFHIDREPARGHAQVALRLLDALPERDRPVAYLDALHSLAYLDITSGSVDVGERLAKKVVAAGEARDDRWSQGMARTQLAFAAARRGDLDEAYARLERLNRWASESDSTFGVIASTYNLGMVALQRGDHDRARRHLEAVIRDKERTGCDPFGRAHGHLDELEALVSACRGQADLDAARRYAAEGLAAARRIAAREHVARFEQLLNELGPHQPDYPWNA